MKIISNSKRPDLNESVIKKRLYSHYSPLDGVRGLAILLVMAEHLFLFDATSYWQYPFSWIVKTGWIGVDLFFVLSGFLITGILYEAKNSQNYFRKFYLRRLKRIFPLYYAYIGTFTLGILSLIYFSHGPAHEKASEALRELPWVWFFGTNILIAKTGVFITASINHFWSLAIEEQFYLIWPLFVLFLDRKHLMQLCLLFFCISLMSRLIVIFNFENYEIINHVSTISRFDEFASGGFVALLLRSPINAFAFQHSTKMIFFFSLLAIILCEWLKRGLNLDPGYVQVGEYTFSAMFFGALIFQVCIGPEHSFLNWFFNLYFLRTFGKYSYAIYIFHWPLLITFNWFILSHFNPADFLSTMGIPFILLRGIMIGGISFVMAWLSWHSLEKRFLRGH